MTYCKHYYVHKVKTQSETREDHPTRAYSDPSIRVSYLVPIFYPYFVEITIKANIKSIFMKHDLIYLSEIHSKFISKLPTMMLSNEKKM